uniref:PH domain-containing protein n=1 Tax=Sphaeramia orbicularis TaxID=375764 RepID=A0A673AX27_9TELE
FILVKFGLFWRWKLNWCDLWIDGSLCFYKTERRRELEHRISLKTGCVDVRSGLECGDVSPPETNPRENLIVVQLRDGSTVSSCLCPHVCVLMSSCLCPHVCVLMSVSSCSHV